MKHSTCNLQSRLAILANLRVLMLGVIFICPHFIIGQITVTSSTFPAAGDKLRYVQASNPNTAVSLFTPPGGNQNWDLSALTSAGTFETNYRPATEGANAAAFPGATMVVINGTDEYYYRSSGTKFELLGQASTTVGGVNLKALYINQPPIAVRHAPLNFFDIYQQSSSNLLAWAFSEIPNSAVNLPVMPDSIRIRISNQIVEVVDGWGTLTLPGALPQPQFPVLRLKKTTYHEQRIDAKVPPLGWLDVTDNVVRGGSAWSSLFGVDTTVTHHYFNNIEKEEIATLTFNNEQNAVISVVYKNVAAVNNPCPTPNTLSVNPANPVCSGISVTLTAKATGTGTLTVKWQRKGANDANYTDVTTATAYTSGTNADFMISSISTVDNNALYRAVFTSSTCTNPVFTNAVTMMVNPVPQITAVANKTVCAGASVPSVVFSSDVQGAVFSWSRTNQAIGLGSNSGTGNIPAFTATNSGTTPLTATFSAVASFTNNGVTCTGTPIQFTITVNPSPNINAITNQTYCAGASVPSVVFSSNIPGATFSWSRTNEAIGLGTNSGTGNIPAFTATNSGTTPLIATFSAVASFTNNGVTCTGTPIQFTLTVNPSPTINAIANQGYCVGTSVPSVVFSSNIPGAIFLWSRTNEAIGLGINSGTGNIPAFTATNSGTTPLTATFSAVASFTNNGVTCTGTPIQFTITVNLPLTPSVSIGVSSNPICPGTSVTFTPTPINGGAPPQYQWYKNGGILNGETGATLVSNSLAANDKIKVRMTSTATCVSPLSVESNEIMIILKTPSIAPTGITGISTICNGESTTLTLVGGSAGTGATAEWFTGSCGGIAAGIGNSINISPSSSTTYFVRFNGDCNTTSCASQLITVNTLSSTPTGISGVTNICLGNSTTLTVSGGFAGTGAIAEWFTGSCGGTPAGTGNSIIVSPTVNTSYYVRYKGICNTTACASVTVNVSTPSVGGVVAPAQSQGCGQQTVNLSVSGINGSVTNWERQTNCTGAWAAIGNAGLNAITLTTPNSSTCYRVAVTNGVCPTAFSSVSTITVDKPAAGGKVTLQSNQTATSIALCPSENALLIAKNYVGKVANWQYTFSTSPIWYDLPDTEGQQSLTVNGSTVISTTFYRVVITSALGICTGTASVAYSLAFRVNKKLSCLSPGGSVLNTDITTIKGFKVVQAYPNPANAVLTLQLENMTEGVTQFEIMDITGKVVKIENKFLTEGYNEVTLDIQNLSNGLHVIKIKDRGHQVAVVKMSKM